MNNIPTCDYVTQGRVSECYPQHAIDDDLDLLLIDSPLCSARVLAQGAQLLEFQAKGNAPLLWLSPAARFTAGKSPRGGVPVCLPWFGPWKGPESRPQHGFARQRPWQLEHASTNNERVTLRWLLRHDARLQSDLFPWSFCARLEMTFDTQLSLSLTVSNESDTTMPLTWALHSYHPVADLSTTEVEGLSGSRYLDNTRQLAPIEPGNDLAFGREVDRIYLNVDRQQILRRPPIEPIAISAVNSPSAIVWNPGAEKAASMSDLTADHYQKFVCIERGCAADNAIALPPGESYQGIVTLGQL